MTTAVWTNQSRLDNVETLWPTVMGLLKRDLPADHFQRLSQSLSAVQLQDSVLTLAIADREARDWLDSHLRGVILGCAAEVTDAVTGVRFVAGIDSADNAAKDNDGPDTHSIDLDVMWQSVLGQLQMEVPKVSFDKWVRDTWVLGFEAGTLTIGVRNTDARDWLESRLSSTISRLLIGIMNRGDIVLRFVVADNDRAIGEEDVAEDDGEEHETGSMDDGEEVRGRFAYVSRYQEIVKPHRVIVVDAYILRLLPEIGARRFWMYVGTRQAGWSHSKGAARGDLTFRVPVSQIARYAGVSRATLFRWISKKDFWDHLAGLVEKTSESPQWVTGPDSRRHQAPNEFTVHMTLPLSWADALALRSWLADRIQNMTLPEALKLALDIPSGKLVGEIFLPIGAQPSIQETRSKLPIRPLTVMDIARELSGKKKLSRDDQLLAEALHTKIVTAFGTIAITHYFVEQVIPQAGLSPEEAALLVVFRSNCYANPKTGEVRNKVVVYGGFEEIASWIGLNRTRTIWEWLTGRIDKKELDGDQRLVNRRTIKGQGRMLAFIRIEGELRGGAGSSEKRFTVRLMEPIFDGNETHSNDGNDTHSIDGIGTHNDDGNETHNNDGNDTDSWRNWDGLNDSNNLLFTFGITRDTITAITGKPAGDSAIPFQWSLGTLLVQNGIYPVNIKKILNRNIPPEHIIAWMLYCYSPAGTNLKPEDTLVSNLLHTEPAETPGKPYDTLAHLPPKVIYELVKATPPYPKNGAGKGTGNSLWDQTMGYSNPRIDELRLRFFGEK